MTNRNPISERVIAQVAQESAVAPLHVRKILEELIQLKIPVPPRRSNYGDLVRESVETLRETREQYQTWETSDVVPPVFPSHIQIQTVGGCNASCVMCAMSSPIIRKLQRGLLSDDLFERIVTECVQFKACNEIALYLQNEPLLDPRLAARVSFVKDKSHGRLFTRLVTNGSLLFRSRIKELIDAGLDRISISVNAFTEPTYTQIMGGLDFSQTLANIEDLLELAPENMLVLFTFMVTSLNETEVRDAIDYWSSRGVLCGAYGINTMSGNVPNFESIRSVSAPDRPKECYLPLESAAILCSGDVILCCTDWARKSICGNINTQSLYQVWHSDDLSRLRRDAIFNRFNHEICSKCLGQTRVVDNLLYDGKHQVLTSLE